MRVGLTVWDGRVSPVFDVCRESMVLEIEDQEVMSSTRRPLTAVDPVGRARQLAEYGIETLICGAISNEAQAELQSKNIRVIAFVAGEVEAVLTAFLADKLPRPGLAMPGCGRRRRARSRGNGRRRGQQQESTPQPRTSKGT